MIYDERFSDTLLFLYWFLPDIVKSRNTTLWFFFWSRCIECVVVITVFLAAVATKIAGIPLMIRPDPSVVFQWLLNIYDEKSRIRHNPINWVIKSYTQTLQSGDLVLLVILKPFTCSVISSHSLFPECVFI